VDRRAEKVGPERCRSGLPRKLPDKSLPCAPVSSVRSPATTSADEGRRARFEGALDRGAEAGSVLSGDAAAPSRAPSARREGTERLPATPEQGRGGERGPFGLPRPGSDPPDVGPGHGESVELQERRQAGKAGEIRGPPRAERSVASGTGAGGSGKRASPSLTGSATVKSGRSGWRSETSAPPPAARSPRPIFQPPCRDSSPASRFPRSMARRFADDSPDGGRSSSV